MSSPTSDASSSRDTLDDRNDQLQQSTKDRRRERNRLAAQKHRLRRNERMSQLEAQVLALQQEKHALQARIDRDPALSPSPASARQLSPPPRAVKRPRTERARDISDPLNSPDSPSDYVASLQERIVELERWTEELDGALSDTRDSESRWRSAYAEDHRALKYADAHAGRLASELRALESERLDHLRELADLKHDFDTECATVGSLRAENVRLTECLEDVKVALDLQLLENDKLRDRLADAPPRASSLERRLAEELEDAQREVEKSRVDIERLRIALGDAHAQCNSKSVSVTPKPYGGSSAPATRTDRSHSPSGDAQRQISDLKAKLASFELQTGQLIDAEKEIDALFRERYRLNERIASLENQAQKVESFLAVKGIVLELD